MRLPDVFQDQDKPEKQYDEARLNAPHIVETVLTALRHNSTGIEGSRRAGLVYMQLNSCIMLSPCSYRQQEVAYD